MTKLTHKSKHKIEPSSRDSISSWLDVLTSMLAVSESQRDQVRDELEDHLRSRVDDLLIVGKPEPEAIQIAVAELGETAELAKLITHAHTRINPRRKLMNTALIAVALGGMSFGGFTLFTGTGAPSATPNNGGAVPVVMPGEARRDDGNTHTFDLEEVPDIQAVEAIAEAFGLEVVVSDGLKSYYRKAGFPYKFTLQGEYTLEQAVKALEWSDVKKLHSRVVRYNDHELQLMTADEFIRQQIETRVYPIPEWIFTKEQSKYPGSLTSLIGVKYDLSYTSIRLVGDSIVVAAPPAIHDEIVAYEAELSEVLRSQKEKKASRLQLQEAERKLRDEERNRERRERSERSAKKRQQAIERVQEEFDRVRNALITSKMQVKQFDDEIAELTSAFDRDKQISRAERAERVSELKAKRIDAELRKMEYENRYLFLRDKLINTEYAELFVGLN